MASSPMRDVLDRERVRLEGQLTSLERDWRNAPKLIVLCLLAIPLGIFLGVGWALLFVALVFSLAGTVLYLVGVRRKEYQHELDEILKQLSIR